MCLRPMRWIFTVGYSMLTMAPMALSRTPSGRGKVSNMSSERRNVGECAVSTDATHTVIKPTTESRRRFLTGHQEEHFPPCVHRGCICSALAPAHSRANRAKLGWDSHQNHMTSELNRDWTIDSYRTEAYIHNGIAKWQTVGNTCDLTTRYRYFS